MELDHAVTAAGEDIGPIPLGAENALAVTAAAFGRADMVSVLLKRGAEVGDSASYWSYVAVSANTQTEFPAGNALNAATANGHQEVIDLLKAHGA